MTSDSNSLNFIVFYPWCVVFEIPVMHCRVILPMHNRMLSICNVQKLILSMKFEEHRLLSCERREWNRELNWCVDQEQRFALITARLAIHYGWNFNVHTAICVFKAWKCENGFVRIYLTTGHLTTKQVQTFPWDFLWELYTIYKS